MSRLPSLLETKRILAPSGDHFGFSSRDGLLVMLTRPEPSGEVVNSSRLPPISETNTRGPTLPPNGVGAAVGVSVGGTTTATSVLTAVSAGADVGGSAGVSEMERLGADVGSGLGDRA